MYWPFPVLFFAIIAAKMEKAANNPPPAISAICTPGIVGLLSLVPVTPAMPQIDR